MSIPAQSDRLPPESRYRPDIDGLRALAVLAVIGYHAFPSAASGGFVGVDVFFVISGFLITSIIASGLERRNFTFGEFYSRRIRRIFPALIVVLASCIAIGWFIQVPGDYAVLGKHIVGGALFVSNILLWQESGYFDAVAQFKPLLHLWSLGIEEQFYLLWPALLWVVWRLRMNASRTIFAIAVVSFIANVVMLQGHPSAVFYLPFTRFWELSLGGLLAKRASTRDVTDNGSRTVEWAAFAGMALLACAIFGLHDDVPFPGARALVPTLGTLLLIGSGPTTIIARRVLSLRPLVAIGLISYPLYLWHWPLLSFARIESAGEIPASWRAALITASFLLAWATYALVEIPFRFRLKRLPSVIVLCLLMTATATAGWILLRAQGFPLRAGEPVRRYANYRYEFRIASREGVCSLVDSDQPLEFPAACMDSDDGRHRPLVVLWGDSHAAMFYPGLRAVAERYATRGEDFRIAQFTRSGCRPFLRVGYDLCLRGNAAILRVVARERPEYVLLFSHWNHLKFHSGAEMLEQLEPTISALKRLGVPHIVVMGPAPRWKGTLPDDLVRLYRAKPFLRVPDRTSYGLNPDAIALDGYLQKTLGQRSDLRYFSVIRVLCNDRGCLTRIGDDPDILTTWDYGHLAVPAATFVAAQLASEENGFAASNRNGR